MNPRFLKIRKVNLNGRSDTIKVLDKLAKQHESRLSKIRELLEIHRTSITTDSKWKIHEYIGEMRVHKEIISHLHSLINYRVKNSHKIGGVE